MSYNWYYDGKQFQNGNINVRFSAEEIQNIKKNRYSSIELLSLKLSNFDSYFIGDIYCLSNYTMGHTIYNCNLDKCYVLNFSDIDCILMNGKTLKLIAFIPDNDMRQLIDAELNIA